jgi:hypothetical protein
VYDVGGFIHRRNSLSWWFRLCPSQGGCTVSQIPLRRKREKQKPKQPSPKNVHTEKMVHPAGILLSSRTLKKRHLAWAKARPSFRR